MSALIDDSITIYEALKNIENGKYVISSALRRRKRQCLNLCRELTNQNSKIVDVRIM